MHPYEVEIFVREKQRGIQRLRSGVVSAASKPGWQDRLLGRIGTAFIGCGHRLCRISGLSVAAPGRRSTADLPLL